MFKKPWNPSNNMNFEDQTNVLNTNKLLEHYPPTPLCFKSVVTCILYMDSGLYSGIDTKSKITFFSKYYKWQQGHLILKKKIQSANTNCSQIINANFDLLTSRVSLDTFTDRCFTPSNVTMGLRRSTLKLTIGKVS